MAPDTILPKYNLRDLGYAFNKKGELRSISEDEPFQFTTQENYELLGDAMTHEVYNLLESVGLQRLSLKKPTDKRPDEFYSFVFASPDFELKETLLILIHGSGAVRAGQWARKLILNENLDRGSQLPYIERALASGWGVLVTNTNNNTVSMDGTEMSLSYSRSSEKHLENVWYRFIRFARCNTIHVVAHSRGGCDISHLMDVLNTEVRVDCICLTDSWFEFSRSRTQQPIVINWAAKPKALMKKPIEGDRSNRQDKVHQIWAGTQEHERSSCMAIDSIFHVLENRPNKDNIDRLLIDAWDIMDPPQLEAVIEDDGENVTVDDDDEETAAARSLEDELEYNIAVDIESVGAEEVIGDSGELDYHIISVEELKEAGDEGDYSPEAKRPRSN